MGKGLQCVYMSAESLTSVLPPQGRGSGFPGRRRPRGAGLSGRAGRGRARSKNGVNPSINPGVRTAERRLYSLHIVNGFCIFIPDWVMKAPNFSKSQIFSGLFFFTFFDVVQIITIETPYQVKEEEDNAMHSTVVIFSSNDNFTLKQVQFYCTQILKTHDCTDGILCLTIYLGSASVFLFKTMQWKNSRSMKDSKNWIQ